MEAGPPGVLSCRAAAPDGIRDLVVAAGKDGTRELPEAGTIWYNLRGDSQDTAIWHTFISMPNMMAEQVGLPNNPRRGRRLADVRGHAGSPHHDWRPLTGREFLGLGVFDHESGGGVHLPPISLRLRITSLCGEPYEVSTDRSSCLRSSCLRHDVCNPEQTDVHRHDHR